MCRTRYREFEDVGRAVQDAPHSAEDLRKKLWGQRFAMAEAHRHEPLASEARAVSELDRLLGHITSPTDTPGTLRTKDGHWVRSKSEREIANLLFHDRIAY